jgi:LuxR family maltose regulon positive regulatory protein
MTNSRLFSEALIGLALVAERRSDWEAMATWVTEARSFAAEVQDPHSVAVAELADARWHAGSTGLASLPPQSANIDDAIWYWLEVPSITRAEMMLRDPDPGTHQEAHAFVTELLARVEAVDNHRQRLRLLVLQADALEAIGRHERAVETMQEAVLMAEPQRIVRPFIGGGPRSVTLLEAVAARSGRNGFLAQLLRILPTSTPAAHRGPEIGPSLTRREIETVELLSRRMTNKEIASRLGVSSAAVKHRLESIYAKLDVHTRRQAVEAAVARGLIRTPRL